MPDARTTGIVLLLWVAVSLPLALAVGRVLARNAWRYPPAVGIPRQRTAPRAASHALPHGHDRRSAAPRRAGRSGSRLLVVASGAALLTATGASAAAALGNLPRPVQHAAHVVIEAMTPFTVPASPAEGDRERLATQDEAAPAELAAPLPDGQPAEPAPAGPSGEQVPPPPPPAADGEQPLPDAGADPPSGSPAPEQASPPPSPVPAAPPSAEPVPTDAPPPSSAPASPTPSEEPTPTPTSEPTSPSPSPSPSPTEEPTPTPTSTPPSEPVGDGSDPGGHEDDHGDDDEDGDEDGDEGLSATSAPDEDLAAEPGGAG